MNIYMPPAAHLFVKRWDQKLFQKALRAISALRALSKVLIKLLQKVGGAHNP